MKKLELNQIEVLNGGACGWGWCTYSTVRVSEGCNKVIKSFRLFWLDTGISDSELEGPGCNPN